MFSPGVDQHLGVYRHLGVVPKHWQTLLSVFSFFTKKDIKSSKSEVKDNSDMKKSCKNSKVMWTHYIERFMMNNVNLNENWYGKWWNICKSLFL